MLAGDGEALLAPPDLCADVGFAPFTLGEAFGEGFAAGVVVAFEFEFTFELVPALDFEFAFEAPDEGDDF